MRILLVEDDALLGDAVCVGLTQAGFTVDWVKDGKAALAAATAGWHDLVVLDLGLPVISGQQMYRKNKHSDHIYMERGCEP